MIRCNFKLESDTAKMPTKHTEESAGIDFYSDDDIRIEAGGKGIVSLGVSWNPTTLDISWLDWNNIVLIIQSRSGLAFKKDIESSNAGVIDADFINTPERKAIMKCKLYNHGSEPFYVKKGDKICQGVLHLAPKPVDVEILDTDRAGKGFGSSDIKG